MTVYGPYVHCCSAGMFASLQVELLYEQRGYLLLADRIQMFIVGIAHGLLCAPRAAWIQDDNAHVGPGGKVLTQTYQEGYSGRRMAAGVVKCAPNWRIYVRYAAFT